MSVEREPRLPTRALVKLPRDPSACWPWIGTCIAAGYGKKQFAGKTMLAHRWVWQMLFGPIPDGMVIDHTCQNPGCVNPHHLRVVTQAENVRAGLTTSLTAGDVAEIRQMVDDGWMHADIAQRFGVTRMTVTDIANRKSWRSAKPFYGARSNAPDKAA